MHYVDISTIEPGTALGAYQLRGLGEYELRGLGHGLGDATGCGYGALGGLMGAPLGGLIWYGLAKYLFKADDPAWWGWLGAGLGFTSAVLQGCLTDTSQVR